MLVEARKTTDVLAWIAMSGLLLMFPLMMVNAFYFYDLMHIKSLDYIFQFVSHGIPLSRCAMTSVTWTVGTSTQPGLERLTRRRRRHDQVHSRVRFLL